MRTSILAFLLGISALLFFKHLPDVKWAGAIIFFAISALAIRLDVRIVAFAIGIAWGILNAHWQINHLLPSSLEGKTLVVVGHISSLPENENHHTHFEFKSGERKFCLSWFYPPASLNVGDEWRLHVRLKRPKGTLNPGGVDFESVAFEQGIHAMGYVVAGRFNRRLHSDSCIFPIDRLRQHFSDSIKKALEGKPFVGVITALAVGSRAAVSPEQWRVLQQTGTNHLIAIAGLHVGFVAGFFYSLCHFLWRRSCHLPLLIPAPEAAALASLSGAIIYSALAGFALPTQRAVMMIFVFLLAALLRKNLLPWQAWCLALAGVLIIEPLAVLSMSFWLSFGAVAIIIYGVSARWKAHGFYWHWGHTQWVVALGLIPLTLLFFHQTSPIGLVANAIAIPWVGFIVLPLSLLGSFFSLMSSSLSHFLWLLAEHFLEWLWIILVYLASFDQLQWHAYMPSAKAFVAVMSGVLLLLAPRGFPARWLGIVGFLPLFLWKPPEPKAGEVWFTLLDVGQGLASVVQTAHHTLVYDTGVKYGDHFDMGSAVVVPFLRYSGIDHVDLVVISHGDNDHSGGAKSLYQSMVIKQILSSVPKKFSSMGAGRCYEGQTWQWDGVTFCFLNPPLMRKEADNNNSCVLKITTGKQSLLLTGDIERGGERYLLQQESLALPSDILVAAHHGSRTSSTPKFVSATHPKFVFFPVGYRNRYHFPSQQVIARYQESGAHLYDTVTCGAITFKLSKDNPLSLPRCYRKEEGHFWN